MAPEMHDEYAAGIMRISGGSDSATMSETSICPPGRRTRAISANTRSFSGERLMTQLEMTQSTEESSTGSSSMMPLRTSTLVKPDGGDVGLGAGDHLVGHVDADDAALRADEARGQQQVDAGAGAEVEDHLARAQARHGERVAAAERVDDGVVGEGGQFVGGVAGELHDGALAGVDGGGVLRRAAAAAAAALHRSTAAAAARRGRRCADAFSVRLCDLAADLLRGGGVGGVAHGVVLSTG